MKNKGFTLIELLVVVAIIGILAAVGVVAYSGYTKGAKENAVKASHKTISNFIINSVTKCSIGEELILKKNSSTNTADLCGYVSSGNASQLATDFANHFRTLKWCNQFGWMGGSTCAEAVEVGGTVGEGTPGAIKLLTKSTSSNILYIDTKYTCDPAPLTETCKQGKTLTSSVTLN